MNLDFTLNNQLDPPTHTDGHILTWRNPQGKLHRLFDLPAYINTHQGYYAWYVDGKQHRTNDQPAVVDVLNGEMQWFQNGLAHRDNDLPALVNNDEQIWKKFGVYHRESKDEQGNELPAVVNRAKNCLEWWVRGLLHRDNDKPAIIYKNGEKRWYTNGKLHRANNKPAVYIPHQIQFWENGVRLNHVNKPSYLDLQEEQEYEKYFSRNEFNIGDPYHPLTVMDLDE